MRIPAKLKRLSFLKRLWQFAPVITALVALNACSTVKVKTKSGLVTREGLQSAKLLQGMVKAPFSVLGTVANSSTSTLKKASRLESNGQTIDAAGCYLKTAADSYELLASASVSAGSDEEKVLIELHNSSLARFAEMWATDPRRDGSPGPFEFSCDGNTILATLSANSAYHSGYFDRIIAADAVRGKGIVSKTRAGIGAALVGIRDQTPGRAEEMNFYPLRGLHTPVTLTVDSSRKQNGVTSLTLSQRNPMVEQTVSVRSRSLPLAADFSAPIAVILKGRNELTWGLDGFFKADERLKQSGIFMLEPYDPDRIPVLLIHGLVSVPIIWRDIIPDLLADPEISRRYQVMVFAYPSGFPLAESAALLRDELAAIRTKYDPDGNDPLSRNMVVAGHSMGGMLTHTLVADIGDNLWKQFSDTPLDEIPMDEEQKKTIRRLLFFEPDPAVRRVVYFSAPHRGAKLAQKNVMGLVSTFAKLPANVIQDATKVFDPELEKYLKIPIDTKYTSRESLEPGAPMVVAMDLSPYKKGVIYHSIIGDRGKGDTPNSSDGLVEYWSSHQDGAASELIVPTGHLSYESPLAIEDFRRILREHAGIR